MAALFVFSGLIWSDFEALILLESFSKLTYGSLVMIFIRLSVGALLLLNYLDTRNE